jgi:hypothetical protein
MKLAVGGSKPSALFDGDWVVYQATGENNRISLWKVPIEGEGGRRASRLTDPQVDAENPAVSPDGRRIAYVLKESAESTLKIAIFAADRQSLDSYDLPSSVHLPIIRWRDGETLLYIDQTGEGSDIWEQRLDHRIGARRLGFSSRPDFNSILNFDCGKDDRLVLSAGAVRRDVVELALRRHQ